MNFTNRTTAGQLLAKKLESFSEQPNVIILGLPRGGVVVAAEVAKRLKLPLDLVVTRKISAPINPEYAIGAITATGLGVWNKAEVDQVDKVWLKNAVASEQQEVIRRTRVYRGHRPILELKGKTAVLVDDGIATGLTMRAAVQAARQAQAKKVVVAVPVASREAVVTLQQEADEVITLDVPNDFGAVGEFYDEFPQVEDEEVIEIMKQ